MADIKSYTKYQVEVLEFCKNMSIDTHLFDSPEFSARSMMMYALLSSGLGIEKVDITDFVDHRLSDENILSYARAVAMGKDVKNISHLNMSSDMIDVVVRMVTNGCDVKQYFKNCQIDYNVLVILSGTIREKKYVEDIFNYLTWEHTPEQICELIHIFEDESLSDEIKGIVTKSFYIPEQMKAIYEVMKSDKNPDSFKRDIQGVFINATTLKRYLDEVRQNNPDYDVPTVSVLGSSLRGLTNSFFGGLF